MGTSNSNATRAGRTIANLDDRKKPGTNSGNQDKTGKTMPRYKDDALVTQQTEALDHIQVSAIADEAENGKVTVDESTKPANKKAARASS